MKTLMIVTTLAVSFCLTCSMAAAQDAFSGAAAEAQDRFAGPMASDERADPADIAASGWETAPSVGGAVPWTVFGTTKEVMREYENGRGLAPVFSDAVRELEGQVVRVNGYMMPLEQKLRQSHFLILAYPLHCPFCVSAGPTQMVEVEAAEPVEFVYDARLVEGRLVLLENDDDGMYYKLVDARAVKR